MKRMNQNRTKRPKTFEDKLRDFMKESDAKQKEVTRRSNKNVRRGRRKPPARRMEDT